MSVLGYTATCRPCYPDGEFSPESGPQGANVGKRLPYFRIVPSTGRGRYPGGTGKSDPLQTFGGAHWNSTFWNYHMRNIPEPWASIDISEVKAIDGVQECALTVFQLFQHVKVHRLGCVNDE